MADDLDSRYSSSGDSLHSWVFDRNAAVIVNLTQEDLLIINFVGRSRSLIARAANVVDVKQGDQDGVDSDVMGFAAEYAFAKHQNLFPDFGLSPRSGTADGVMGKFKYDVKSTHLPNGRLLCTLKENASVDIYILAIVASRSVNFPGWAYSSDLRKDENIKNLGHGNGYVMDQSKLRRFKEDSHDGTIGVVNPNSVLRI